MQNLTNLFKVFGRSVSNNSPAILTAVASTGVLTTAVLAVKATPKAMSLIAQADSERTDEGNTPTLDVIKLTWTCYIPAAAVGAATIACVIGANSISTKRNAALMSVYSLTDQAFKEYQAKVAETIGETKEQAVRDEVAKDRVKNDPVSGKEVIITGRGEQLCYDSLTGRYFNSDVESIRKAENDINARMIHDVYASQNDFYREIGLDPIPNGDELGWTTASMLDIYHTAMMSSDGRPCISINYRVDPIRGYYHLGG